MVIEMTSASANLSGMPKQYIDYPDALDLTEAAERLLRHHEQAVNVPVGQQSTEADIRHSLVDLLVAAGLVVRDDVRLEADRTDIRTGDLIIEVKKRIGIGMSPDRDHVAQLDRYLSKARESGDPERLGILTDGRHWMLRRTGTEVGTNLRYSFRLQVSSGVADLVAWLRDETQALPSRIQTPTPDAVKSAFGISVSAEVFLEELRLIYNDERNKPTVIIKRNLWRDLLAAALGEVVNEEEDLGRLFIRHTYLSTIVALAVQAAFGVNVAAIARRRPSDLINGRAFRRATGVQGVIESDFFGWPAETQAGCEWIAGLANRVAGFDWNNADYDIARVLYQTVIDADDRRRLGEYYTPDWLAEAIVTEVVDDPLTQRVLDPACGSGTFLRAAIASFIRAAKAAGLNANRILSELQEKVIGIDIHPVGVHLARTTWVLAAKKVIAAADDASSLTVPVYLGDSMQLFTDSSSLLDTANVTVEIKPDQAGGRHRFMYFPKGLVAQGDRFDYLMLKAAEAIEAGFDSTVALDDVEIPKGDDRETLVATLRTLSELHDEGRNHIWAYYTRNLVRPAWLSTAEGRVDRIVGNPPWITYSRTEADVRIELERQSKTMYRIWVGDNYAPHQDMAGWFCTRSMALYLRTGGKVGMVLPHSALVAGQYENWRTGSWGETTGADLNIEPWDLEKIEPNSFFPIPACVIFAIRTIPGESKPLAQRMKRWLGSEGGPYTIEIIRRNSMGVHVSPYAKRAREGATIVPRVLFFVGVTESTTALAKGIVDVEPMRTSQEKMPWKNLNHDELSGPVEEVHVNRVHRGDTVMPFGLLAPRHAVLPLLQRGKKTAISGVDPADLRPSMRIRWEHMNDLWNTHRSQNNDLTLIHNLDYHKKLSSQLGYNPIRLVYTSSGRPTAAVLTDNDVLIDYTLFWLPCDRIAEAYYLAAIINSSALYEAVKPLMAKGQYGPRHLQKHLWRLPIGEYDPDSPIHKTLAEAGSVAADRVAEVFAEEKQARAASGKEVTVGVARKVIRAWLEDSDVGRAIEAYVEELMSGSESRFR